MKCAGYVTGGVPGHIGSAKGVPPTPPPVYLNIQIYMLQTAYQKNLKKKLKKKLTRQLYVVIYLHGRNSMAGRKPTLEQRVQMFVHKIAEKHWLGTDGKTLYTTRFVGHPYSDVTSVGSFTHPHLAIEGVFSSPVSGVNVQMRNSKTGQVFWLIVE